MIREAALERILAAVEPRARAAPPCSRRRAGRRPRLARRADDRRGRRAGRGDLARRSCSARSRRSTASPASTRRSRSSTTRRTASRRRSTRRASTARCSSPSASRPVSSSSTPGRTAASRTWASAASGSPGRAGRRPALEALDVYSETSVRQPRHRPRSWHVTATDRRARARRRRRDARRCGTARSRRRDRANGRRDPRRGLTLVRGRRDDRHAPRGGRAARAASVAARGRGEGVRLDAALDRVAPEALGGAVVLPLLNGLEHVETIRTRGRATDRARPPRRGREHRQASRRSSPEPGLVVQTTPTPRVTAASDEHGARGPRRAARRRSHVPGIEVAVGDSEARRAVGEGGAARGARGGDRRRAAARSAAPRAIAAGVRASRRRSTRRARWRRPTASRSTPPHNGRSSRPCPTTLTTSAARDVASGGPTELDAIAGSVVRAGAGSASRHRRFGVSSRRQHAERDSADRRARGLRARAREERPAARGPSAARLRDRDGAPVGGLRPRRRLDRHRARSPQVARWYGADVPFLRPDEYATATSPDIEWIAWTLPRLEERYDLFAIVRATNPFRGPGRDPPRARAAARDARGRLDPRRRARQAAPWEDVDARRGRPH